MMMMILLVPVLVVLPVVVSIDFVMLSFLLGMWDQHLYLDQFSTFKSKGVYFYIVQRFLISFKYKNYKKSIITIYFYI
jgi:hypothetical protein